MRVLILTTILSAGVAAFSTDGRDVLQETIKIMLDYSSGPEDDSRSPIIRESRAASKYMHKLYGEMEKEESDDGNIVRSIEPSVGKMDGQEVLVFDISGIGKEQIMRGELHFHLRKRAIDKRRAKALSARTLCTNEYCSESQSLEAIRYSRDGAVWDSTKSLAESHALGADQLVVRIFRKDVKMRSYSEMVRKSSPFLLVFSNGNNSIDAGKVKEGVEITRRKRRNSGYYTYNSESGQGMVKASLRTTKVEEDKEQKMRKQKKIHKIRAGRRNTMKDDIWNGFGTDEDEEESDDGVTSTTTERSNDVRVVLMEKDKNQVCHRSSLEVDLVELGWADYVISPLYFEAGYCGGTCPSPLPKESNPSNHAILQSLLQSEEMPSVCCSPESLSSLTILFRDESGRLVLKSFPRMIVDSCACL